MVSNPAAVVAESAAKNASTNPSGGGLKWSCGNCYQILGISQERCSFPS